MICQQGTQGSSVQLFVWKQSGGEDKLGRLISLLIANGRTKDAQNAAINKKTRADLYKEFGIFS